MTDHEILHEEMLDSGILRLTLNDEKRRNALSEAMLTALSDALLKAGDNQAVRVIILSAKGSCILRRA